MSRWHRLQQALSAAYRPIAEMDLLDLVPRMTILLLLLYAGNDWYLLVPIRLLCGGAILLPSLGQRSGFWFLVTGVVALGNGVNWYSIDNHKFLMTYWCLALACAFASPKPRPAIALNARLLIGLSFAFALLWKLISPDFLNGSFLHYTLLTDSRFAAFAALVGGESRAILAQNRQHVIDLKSYDSLLNVVSLHSSARLLLLARLMTGWTVVIEGLLALSFLWPVDRGLARWRNLLLVLFALTTYPVATVTGYGWLLMIMGLAQCSAGQQRARLLYLASFCMIMLFNTPWLSSLGSLVRRGLSLVRA
jgi:hypothetical protein